MFVKNLSANGNGLNFKWTPFFSFPDWSNSTTVAVLRLVSIERILFHVTQDFPPPKFYHSKRKETETKLPIRRRGWFQIENKQVYQQTGAFHWLHVVSMHFLLTLIFSVFSNISNLESYIWLRVFFWFYPFFKWLGIKQYICCLQL